jgi:tetratricopeptide (TPR) repeat protein
VLGLKAVNCQSGDPLAEEQVTAASKEKVLDAMGTAASRLRGQLGESLATVKAFDVPLEQASTPSLDALKAYSLGRKMEATQGGTPALPFYQRAVELDPNFAMAYQELAVTYSSLSQLERGAQNARKAYNLRAKVTDRERFSIEGYYYTYATGELDKAAQSYELWQQAYPRDGVPYRNLGNVYNALGNLEKALEEYREALRLEPNAIWNYGNLASAYLNLNRLNEAEVVLQQAENRKLNGYLLVLRRRLAFLKGDEAQMVRLAAAAMGEPGAEDQMLGAQANYAAWQGKIKDADDFTRRAMDSALHYEAQETAGGYQVDAALRTVEVGKKDIARSLAAAAVKLAPKSDLRIWAALVLIRAGDSAPAEKLIGELDKEFPKNTLVQGSYLPTLRAAVALERKDPGRAIDLLKAAERFDFGGGFSLYQIYLRGNAYIASHDGKAAAAEFQKFVDHRGQVGSDPLGALARLGSARADVLQGNSVTAKAKYQDFFTLWKDSDPEIPILKEAKAEYEKLP